MHEHVSTRTLFGLIAHYPSEKPLILKQKAALLINLIENAQNVSFS